MSQQVQHHYSRYIQRGGDGEEVWDLRASKLGYLKLISKYSEYFKLSSFETKNTSIRDSNSNSNHHAGDSFEWQCLKKLFAASCGSGCPLNLEGGPQKGETCVDLGCGAGHDLVLAALMVDPTTTAGRVVGVDVTPEMIQAAIRNVDRFLLSRNDSDSTTTTSSGNNHSNVEFVEHAMDDMGLVVDALGGPEMADVVISNGVFNLCADKFLAFEVVHRILKPGGRFLFSDVCRIVLDDPDPEKQYPREQTKVVGQRKNVTVVSSDGWSH